MTKHKDNVVDFNVERTRRTGVPPGRVRADPNTDTTARLATQMLSVITEDSATMLEAFAGLYLVASVLSREYTKHEGPRAMIDLLQLAKNKADLYQMEKVHESERPLARDPEDEPKR